MRKDTAGVWVNWKMKQLVGSINQARVDSSIVFMRFREGIVKSSQGETREETALNI